MPAMTKFIDGTGPVWAGSLFPFLFITIACGAVSGFHALISSGTTPKMIENETHARFIGYGAMLMESFVAIMALVAASTIDPGVYFAMNSPAALIGTTAESAAQAVSQMGLLHHAGNADADRQGRGRAQHHLARRRRADAGRGHGPHPVRRDRRQGHDGLLVPLRHPVRSAVHPDRRGCGHPRRPLHAAGLLGAFVPAMKKTENTVANLTATGLCVAAWGYFLYQGVVDPLGGINTLWPLFGIANQMLAAIALILGTCVLFKMKRGQYAWVTIVPTVWLLLCTLTAGWQKIFDANPKVGFLAHAAKYQAALDEGKMLAPAKSIAQMQQVIFNDYLDASLAGFFVIVVLSVLVFGARTVLRARQQQADRQRKPDGADHRQGAVMFSDRQGRPLPRAKRAPDDGPA
jgi:carbon starvation protein